MSRHAPGLALLTAALLAAAFLAGCSGDASASRVVTVAAASDLRYAMDALIERYRAAHPETAIRVTYASSGTFFAQLSNGAPFDVFFSADAEYPRMLESAGLAEDGATRLYAIGQIVVWALRSSPLDVETRGLQVLTDSAARTVAIANPEHAPYGRAAVTAMRNAGVYELVAPRLVLGENVSQAAQFVDAGSADVGVIALSLAVAPPLAERGKYGTIPGAMYPPLEQGAVVLKGASDPTAANAFLDFVLGPDGRAVLRRSGLLLPGG